LHHLQLQLKNADISVVRGSILMLGCSMGKNAIVATVMTLKEQVQPVIVMLRVVVAAVKFVVVTGEILFTNLTQLLR